MRGLTIPRPVRVKLVEHMGKEVIVDPTDTPEELTAEQLNATDPLIYRDALMVYDALRARIRTAGIKRVARESGLSLRPLRKLVNEGTKPRRLSLDRLTEYFRG